MNFDNYKFHPSALGKLLTSARDGSKIGETTKKELMYCYIEAKYGRKRDLKNKYIAKGLAVEEDSITLYSRVKKQFFKKNSETLENDWFIGTPDLYEGNSIKEAAVIIDIKSSWDIHTFFNTLVENNKNYYWQGQAYLDLTGAQTFRLAYVLVDTPLQIINDEKRKLTWAMGAISDESPEVQTALEDLEKEMTFGDIPINERWIEFVYERDEKAIQQAKEKLQLCRDFLNELAGRSKDSEQVKEIMLIA